MDVETRKAKAWRYYWMGLNAKEIGKLLDVSHRTIQNYMATERWKEKRSPATIKQRAFEMFGNGMTYAKIAKTLNVSKGTVYNYIREVRESQTN